MKIEPNEGELIADCLSTVARYYHLLENVGEPRELGVSLELSFLNTCTTAARDVKVDRWTEALTWH